MTQEELDELVALERWVTKKEETRGRKEKTLATQQAALTNLNVELTVKKARVAALHAQLGITPGQGQGEPPE